MFLLLCPMSFGADKLGLAVTDFGHNPKRSRSSEQDGMACKFKVNECLIVEKIELGFFTQICTGYLSQLRARLRDWPVRPARAGCYS